MNRGKRKKTKKIKEPDNKIDKLKGNMINYRERNSWKKMVEKRTHEKLKKKMMRKWHIDVQKCLMFTWVQKLIVKKNEGRIFIN